MRTQFPAVKILVGCWGLRDEVKKSVDRLLTAGADLVSAELLETRNLLLPLIQDAAVSYRRPRNRRRRNWSASSGTYPPAVRFFSALAA